MISDRLGAFWTCPHVAIFRDVLIGTHGMIMGTNFKVVRNANNFFDFWYYSRNDTWRPDLWLQGEAAFMHPEKLPQIPLPNGRYVYGLYYFNKYAYGHLWDTIQSLKLVEENQLDGMLLVHTDQSGITDFDVHMSIFGFPADKRVELDVKKNVYYVPELVVPSLYAKPSCFKGSLKHWLLRKYRECPGLVLDDVPRKLYLSRQNAKQRCVINEQRLIQQLSDFTVVTGQEPLREQIRLFHSAAFITGYHGAMFRNILFCNKRPRILEFCAAGREDHCFQDQNETLDITDDYRFVLVDADERHCAYLDPKVIKSMVDEM